MASMASMCAFHILPPTGEDELPFVPAADCRKGYRGRLPSVHVNSCLRLALAAGVSSFRVAPRAAEGRGGGCVVLGADRPRWRHMPSAATVYDKTLRSSYPRCARSHNVLGQFHNRPTTIHGKVLHLAAKVTGGFPSTAGSCGAASVVASPAEADTARAEGVLPAKEGGGGGNRGESPLLIRRLGNRRW